MASRSTDGKPDNATVGPTVFLPLKNSELRELGTKPIKTFLERREQYLLRVEDAAAQGSSYTPVSLVHSVDFKLLKALIAFDTFHGVSDISELSDDVRSAWLEEQLDQSVPFNTPEALEAELQKRVKLDFKEVDPKMRIMNLFMKYYTFLKERNLGTLTRSNPKISVGHICSLLRSLCFRQKIENDLALDKAHLKKDWQGFYHHVVDNAISFEAFHSSMMQTSNRSPQPSSMTRPQKQTHRGTGTRQSRSNDDTLSKSQQKKSSDSTEVKPDTTKFSANASSEATKQDSRQLPLCLNEETCPGEHHYIRDCKKTPEEKKRQLLAERRQKRKQSASSVNRVRISAMPNDVSRKPPLGNGRIPATLSDCVGVTVSGDYGADHAALSEHHLARLAEANVFVPILPLQSPISVHLAVEGRDHPLVITAERKARISTTLSATEGPFRLRNVEYLVFKEPMPEVLLSRPLLQSLGFNLDNHLSRIKQHLQDVDCSSIGFEPNTEIADNIPPSDSKLSRLLYAEIPNEATFLHENNEEAAVTSLPTSEVPQSISEHSIMDTGTHKDSDVQPHIERMYNEALSNGLPPVLASRVSQLLHDYKDIFRIKLGSDPPVNVPPMSIQLVPEASPVRVKLRRYSEPQQKFLRQKVSGLQQLGW